MDSASIKIDSLERLKISRRPFPLKFLLVIYLKARHDCYINYHAGLKLLISWLEPIDIPNAAQYKEIPSVFNNWECQEIAAILGTKPKVIYHTFREIIYHEIHFTNNNS